ncbi:MAG: hypothetical protein HXK49_03150 [Atopobium sp.]|nr:hypothetical protein [Atopobium sp.]
MNYLPFLVSKKWEVVQIGAWYDIHSSNVIVAAGGNGRKIDMAISLIDLIKFYCEKNEHYPISDEFIKKYQQKPTRDSYIDFARTTGHTVSAEQCEPNQKWHLFEAYISWKFKKNRENVGQLRCPELLLWMAEAAGIDDEIVTEAKEAAASEIDRIRKEKPDGNYSAKAVDEMNAKMEEKYGKSLQGMIAEKVKAAL